MRKISSVNRSKLESKKEKVLLLLEEMRVILEESSDSIVDYIDNRSEQWQESEKFDQYDSWNDEVQNQMSLVEDIHSQVDDIDLESIVSYEDF